MIPVQDHEVNDHTSNDSPSAFQINLAKKDYFVYLSLTDVTCCAIVSDGKALSDMQTLGLPCSVRRLKTGSVNALSI